MRLQFVGVQSSYTKKQNGESQVPTKIILIFCVPFKSSTHAGLECVKKSATNISCFGPFKILLSSINFFLDTVLAFRLAKKKDECKGIGCKIL
jgi:hypothetical protein